ncbi:hypothetical protein M8J76_005625 [Diaphorina citri]|nr:hypothetical protein M8J75_005526 [Diaphorina citri]KAI5729703.1 hypothetical protein M8J76_005625 [Diaphorina citri]
MDATVESADYEHPQTLVQDTPYLLTSMWHSGVSLIQNNGWLVLGLCAGLYYLYTKVESSLKQNVDRVLLGKSKKEDGPASDEKLRQVRERMQKELERKAELYKEKMKQKAEEERLKKLEALEKKEEGGPSQDTGNKKKTPLFRDEYNPLMGSGPVNNYRPPRRSACSRGGCGR